ncbi:MAG: N4-gp56 family major capsid protein [Clostridiales bacterium]|nr:N4-gp56 family major capsid protein [Clostridiales bacterium]
MAQNANLSTTAGLSPTMQTYYDRKMILDMKPKLVHYQYGQKRPLPHGSGKQVSFRKWTPFSAVSNALTEGVAPDGQALSLTAVNANIGQYGGYVAVSDLLDMTALDPVVNDSVELMADQGALTIDSLTRAELQTGTNVLYASQGGTPAASRSAITAGHKLTSLELRKAVRLLKRNKAPQFMRAGKGYYVAIVGPDSVFDLQADTLWQDVSKYQESEAIFSGEIGRLFGVIVVETPTAHVFAGAGSGNADVASTLVFGKDAYGVVDLGNANVRAIIKNRGSAGTADPLDQVSTVGWKVDGFAAKILQNAWLVRIEHGFSA